MASPDSTWKAAYKVRVSVSGRPATSCTCLFALGSVPCVIVYEGSGKTGRMPIGPYIAMPTTNVGSPGSATISAKSGIVDVRTHTASGAKVQLSIRADVEPLSGMLPPFGHVVGLCAKMWTGAGYLGACMGTAPQHRALTAGQGERSIGPMPATTGMQDPHAVLGRARAKSMEPLDAQERPWRQTVHTTWLPDSVVAPHLAAGTGTGTGKSSEGTLRQTDKQQALAGTVPMLTPTIGGVRTAFSEQASRAWNPLSARSRSPGPSSRHEGEEGAGGAAHLPSIKVMPPGSRGRPLTRLRPAGTRTASCPAPSQVHTIVQRVVLRENEKEIGELLACVPLSDAPFLAGLLGNSPVDRLAALRRIIRTIIRQCMSKGSNARRNVSRRVYQDRLMLAALRLWQDPLRWCGKFGIPLHLHGHGASGFPVPHRGADSPLQGGRGGSGAGGQPSRLGPKAASHGTHSGHMEHNTGYHGHAGHAYNQGPGGRGPPSTHHYSHVPAGTGAGVAAGAGPGQYPGRGRAHQAGGGGGWQHGPAAGGQEGYGHAANRQWQGLGVNAPRAGYGNHQQLQQQSQWGSKAEGPGQGYGQGHGGGNSPLSYGHAAFPGYQPSAAGPRMQPQSQGQVQHERGVGMGHMQHMQTVHGGAGTPSTAHGGGGMQHPSMQARDRELFQQGGFGSGIGGGAQGGGQGGGGGGVSSYPRPFSLSTSGPSLGMLDEGSMPGSTSMLQGGGYDMGGRGDGHSQFGNHSTVQGSVGPGVGGGWSRHAGEAGLGGPSAFTSTSSTATPSSIASTSGGAGGWHSAATSRHATVRDVSEERSLWMGQGGGGGGPRPALSAAGAGGGGGHPSFSTMEYSGQGYSSSGGMPGVAGAGAQQQQQQRGGWAGSMPTQQGAQGGLPHTYPRGQQDMSPYGAGSNSHSHGNWSGLGHSEMMMSVGPLSRSQYPLPSGSPGSQSSMSGSSSSNGSATAMGQRSAGFGMPGPGPGPTGRDSLPSLLDAGTTLNGHGLYTGLEHGLISLTEGISGFGLGDGDLGSSGGGGGGGGRSGLGTGGQGPELGLGGLLQPLHGKDSQHSHYGQGTGFGYGMDSDSQHQHSRGSSHHSSSFMQGGGPGTGGSMGMGMGPGGSGAGLHSAMNSAPRAPSGAENGYDSYHHSSQHSQQSAYNKQSGFASGVTDPGPSAVSQSQSFYLPGPYGTSTPHGQVRGQGMAGSFQQ